MFHVLHGSLSSSIKYIGFEGKARDDTSIKNEHTAEEINDIKIKHRYHESYCCKSTIEV